MLLTLPRGTASSAWPGRLRATTSNPLHSMQISSPMPLRSRWNPRIVSGDQTCCDACIRRLSHGYGSCNHSRDQTQPLFVSCSPEVRPLPSMHRPEHISRRSEYLGFYRPLHAHAR